MAIGQEVITGRFLWGKYIFVCRCHVVSSGEFCRLDAAWRPERCWWLYSSCGRPRQKPWTLVSAFYELLVMLMWDGTVVVVWEEGRIIESECALCWQTAIVFNRSTFQSENFVVFLRQILSFFFCMHGIGPAGFLKCIDFLYHQRNRHFFKTKELVTFSVCKCKASVWSGLFFLWQGPIILRLYE